MIHVPIKFNTVDNTWSTYIKSKRESLSIDGSLIGLITVSLCHLSNFSGLCPLSPYDVSLLCFRCVSVCYWWRNTDVFRPLPVGWPTMSQTHLCSLSFYFALLFSLQTKSFFSGSCPQKPQLLRIFLSKIYPCNLFERIHPHP